MVYSTISIPVILAGIFWPKEEKITEDKEPFLINDSETIVSHDSPTSLNNNINNSCVCLFFSNVTII